MVFTLDGTAWSKKKLLKKMEGDEFYFGSEGKLYLSSSSIKGLSKDPNKFIYNLENEEEVEYKPNPAFDFGSLFHWYILEPHIYKEQVFVDVDRREVRSGKKL